jgi:hypothetical protein
LDNKDDLPDGEESDDDVVDTEPGMMASDSGTFAEHMTDHITLLHNFADGLEYQLQFNDHWMLEHLEREGVSMLRFTKTCLSHEHRMNSTRGTSPTTWNKATASAMYYRTRPPAVDRESTAESHM